MSKWQPIATVPHDRHNKENRVLIFVPDSPAVPPVFEAIAYPDGRFYDPVYDEWDGHGATHWQPLPDPP